MEDDPPESSIELGFVERLPDDNAPLLFQSPDWRRWDGGLAGGKPVWLNPQQPGTGADLTCGICQEPLCFLLQVYAPLDDVESAFHRALYVFCCRNGRCLKESAGTMQPASMRVLRCQLPRRNPFYAEQLEALGEEGSSRREAAPTCEVCGCAATKKCSRCRGPVYCSRAHQVDHWTHGLHKKVCGKRPLGGREAVSRWRFPAHVIVLGDGNDEESEDSDGAAQYEKGMPSELCNIGKQSDTEKREDENFTQSDVVRISKEMGAEAVEEQDPYTNRFMAVVADEPAQVLRYCRWPETEQAELWVSSRDPPPPDHEAVDEMPGQDDEMVEEYRPKAKTPPCEHCGAPRAFELQIMPQILHLLDVAKSTGVQDGPETETSEFEALDFGTVFIYSCTRSCDQDGPFAREAAWIQAPLT